MLMFDGCRYENSKLKKSMDHIRALEEKLQNAFNENAKLRVRQKEDEKLWKGLESKFSPTKTLCDQLTETLHHLASQVQDAEMDKVRCESKISASSEAIDSLNRQMQELCLRLGAAEENIKSRDNELEELKTEKEQMKKCYLDEQCRTASLIEEKDAMIRNFESTSAERKLNIENLNCQLGKVGHELRMKDDEIKCLVAIQEKLENEKRKAQLNADELSEKLVSSGQEVKKLDGFVHAIVSEFGELDKKNFNLMEKFDKLNGLYDTYFLFLQKERDLASDRAQRSFHQYHNKLLSETSRKEALQSACQELNEKIVELEKAKGFVASQLAEERSTAKQTIKKLESEAESLASKNIETETVISKLKEEIETLLENLRASENKTHELSLKISSLELESKEQSEKLMSDTKTKVEQIEILQKESEDCQLHADSLVKEVNQLQSILEEKDLIILQCKENEKKLDQHITEDKALLVAAETKLEEAKRQYDLMLENKQLELSRHLKELSQRNDQAINEIRRKYDVEKQDIINVEKEKVEKVVKELSMKYDKELADCKEESGRQLRTVQEEHASLIISIKQDFENKELNLKAKHDEEMRRAQILAENELKTRITALRNEHEVQLKAFKCQYEDECRKLQEELDLQKSKEERQRALLQLQWKVMSDKPPEEQEVNSKREYSVSSIKVRESRPGGSKRSQHISVRGDGDEQDSPFVKATGTPVSQLLKKVENANTGSIMSIPKHHHKVTRREYEVETNNGRTITKRRKTRSTVMFEEPRKHKARTTPRAKTPKSIIKVTTTSGPPRSSNIGDLFSEGSLNPYADDPYAFD
ncbi:PREDICTED: synaptonemal complex protein 1-like isoform X2 [Tarenaya hassleriana]|uniref:synaptonemal complex protein 1-like isoform X2 n=1 Tax=Tarenaya hassleriana TaxID=28532 RepID=UPI00053C360E|nr:PREDICTED: synaptonemal complex protein 1-like isoform X2 [Tarenaya hassleriana]